MSTMGEKLNILLKNNEITQAKFAEMMCVSESTVQKWVKDKNVPNIEVLKNICAIFHIGIEEFTDDEKDIPVYYELYESYMFDYPRKYDISSTHIVIDAALKGEGKLHRFRNPAGVECSAIYVAGREIWWHYRDREIEMIKAWNESH